MKRWALRGMVAFALALVLSARGGANIWASLALYFSIALLVDFLREAYGG